MLAWLALARAIPACQCCSKRRSTRSSFSGSNARAGTSTVETKNLIPGERSAAAPIHAKCSSTSASTGSSPLWSRSSTAPSRTRKTLEGPKLCVPEVGSASSCLHTPYPGAMCTSWRPIRRAMDSTLTFERSAHFMVLLEIAEKISDAPDLGHVLNGNRNQELRLDLRDNVDVGERVPRFQIARPGFQR